MKDMTLMNVIFDRSGSMQSIAEEAVGMYNGFLEEQKALPDYAEISLVQFDGKYEECYTCVPIKHCAPLVNGETFVPRGLTALYDAVGKTINTIDENLKGMPEKDRPKRVLFIIITDGHENASKEFSGKTVKDMIENQKKEFSWDFIFLAAGINAFEHGSTFGMDAAKCATYSKTPQGMAQANNTMNQYTTTFRSTGDTSIVVENNDGGIANE